MQAIVAKRLVEHFERSGFIASSQFGGVQKNLDAAIFRGEWMRGILEGSICIAHHAPEASLRNSCPGQHVIRHLSARRGEPPIVVCLRPVGPSIRVPEQND